MSSPETIHDLPVTPDPVTSETIMDPEHGFYSILQPMGKTSDYRAYLRPEYTPEAIDFFVRAVGEIDADLEQRAVNGDPMVKQLYTEDQAREVQNRVNQEVVRSLRDNPRQITIGSFYGIKSPFAGVRAELLETDPEAATRLSGTIVSSTVGDKREPPVILTPLDPRWGDPTYAADIWEDLADSAATVTAIAVERIRHMVGIAFVQTYPDLPKQMQRGIDGKFGDYTDLYRTVVHLLEAANIALALPVSKNQPFLDVLTAHVQEMAGSEWAERQGRYLNTGILTTRQDQWLMGAKQFDSGLAGSNILQKIPSGLHERPDAAKILQFLPQSRIRIGGTTANIIQLTVPGNDLYEYVGKQLGEKLEAYLDWKI